MPEELTELTDKSIGQFVGIFQKHPRYGVSDQAIRIVVDALPKNMVLAEVISKVSIIKTLYATPIYDVHSVCKKIVSTSDFDFLLEAGEPSAVEVVRHGHGIRLKKTGKELDFYSFATKYCSFHNPEAYPIYDNLVADYLLRLNKSYGWQKSIRKSDLLDYGQFRTLLNTFVEFFGLTHWGYKKIDQSLWVLAKYRWLLFNNPRAKDDEWLIDEVEKLNKS